MVDVIVKRTQDLRALNRHRPCPGELHRARIFRAHCVSSLGDLPSIEQCREGLEDTELPEETLVEIRRVQRRLIELEVSDLADGDAINREIDAALEHLESRLKHVQGQLLEEAQLRMERFGAHQRNLAGIPEIQGRQLITVCVQTLGGGTVSIRCALDETMLQVKHHIFCNGGPRVRDQKLLWNSEGLAWVNELALEVRNTYTLFCLGIQDGDSVMLYYVRHCGHCVGPCVCIECHGDGAFCGACHSCGKLRPDCAKCRAPCRCPQCHGKPHENGIFVVCQVCGEVEE